MPLHIVRQDITKIEVDAIVNTTNEQMIGYSGVDKAVHTKAGAELEKECEKLRPLGLGEVKLSGGYDLPAKYIIHTSGPVWRGGLSGEKSILKSCYYEALKLSVEKGFETVAFPLISSGAYGYPKDQVLKFAVQVISDFLKENELTVYLCVFDRTSYEFSRALFCDITDYLNSDIEAVSNVSSLPKRKRASVFPSVYSADECSAVLSCLESSNDEDKSFEEYMKNMDKPFSYKLFDLIDKSGMTDVECYKKANIDKKTFSKIKCNPDTYRPSKQTAVAFAIALKLDIDETQELLASAGLTLSKSFTFDKIIRYFIQKGIYDVFEINEALFEFDQTLLGC